MGAERQTWYYSTGEFLKDLVGIHVEKKHHAASFPFLGGVPLLPHQIVPVCEVLAFRFIRECIISACT